MECISTQRHVPPASGDVSRNLKRMNAVLVTTALLVGLVAMKIDVRFGLFAVAFILGWTQLVGL